MRAPASARITYHTHIKFLARDGLLSASLLQQIPRSNIHRWKLEPAHKYQSFGLNLQATGDYDLLKEFVQHKTAKKVFSSYVRLIKTVVSFAHGLTGFHKIIKDHSKQLVEIITRVRPFIGLVRALRFLNVSVPTFRQWSLQTFTNCFESLTGSCNRIFPNQLSFPQVTRLKELLGDPKFQYWPVSSIALYALRDNILPLNLNTWYKYVHKLGLKRTRPPSRRKKNNISIRARRPHQFWHADITAFVTACQSRHFIYLVVDNFFRKILSWSVADSVKASYRRETIYNTLQYVSLENASITLITDGGPENHLKQWLEDLSLPVQHRKALVDVHYSNSLIEAHNKILKYNYSS